MSATISKTITIEGREYEVDMTWHPDEPAAGLREGWEECSVTHFIRRDPNVYVCFGFVPEYGCSVGEWSTEGGCVILDAWGNHPLAASPKPPAYAALDSDVLTVRTHTAENPKSILLGFLPGFYEAVAEVWTEMTANEKRANDELEEMLAEAGLAAYERRMEG